MNRNGWEFSYTADKLLQAALTKQAHHADRLVWWESQKASVMERIKAEGIEIDESLSNFASNAYRNPTVSVRNDLLADMQECVTKVVEHRAKVAEYEAWGQVLSSQGQAALNLHHDDWHFFFGK